VVGFLLTMQTFQELIIEPNQASMFLTELWNHKRNRCFGLGFFSHNFSETGSVFIVRCGGLKVLSNRVNLCALTQSRNLSFPIPDDSGNRSSFWNLFKKPKRIYIVQNNSGIYKSQHFLPWTKWQLTVFITINWHFILRILLPRFWCRKYITTDIQQ
jgi:hypothetical protein